MSGPVAKSLVLSDHERAVLAGWIRRPTSAARLVQRARIVVAYADSGSVTDVARQVGVSAPTVSKWRDRFLSDRLDGLDGPYPRILDTGCDYAAVGSVAARRAS